MNGEHPHTTAVDGSSIDTARAQAEANRPTDPISNYAERAKALRQHPFVLAWIESYRNAFDWRPKHPDCRHCTYPHYPNVLCGSGAIFGETRIGRDLYSIDFSNVCYFVGFREISRDGWFHWKHDTFFRRTGNGVEVMSYTQYNNTPQEHVWTIPPIEWQSIVDLMERQ